MEHFQQQQSPEEHGLSKLSHNKIAAEQQKRLAACPASVLQERSATHGDFAHGAVVSQRLKFALAEGTNWEAVDVVQREALEAVAGKLARIVTGDASFLDHYRDIIGYTQLAMDYTAKQPLASDVKTTKFQVNGAVVKASA
jgi:hypothetical protein